jgi:menaquinone-dependent protoporphyrinogen oxidase
MRILVAVASKHGSTAELATALAAGLRHHGADVDVRTPGAVSSVAGYDVVIVGSAVYRNRWLRAARDFLDGHSGALRSREVFLFSSGPIAEQGRPVNNHYDVAPAMARTGAREHRTFAGKIDPAVLNAGERVVVRMTGAQLGDFRDWDEIGSWASKIVAQVSDRTGVRMPTEHTR